MNRFIMASVVAVCTPAISQAVDRLAGTQSELISALQAAQPGDNVILKNGVWTGLNIGTQTVNGTAQAPIHIRAQTPGQVAISGNGSIFGLQGSNYTLSGLTFKDENDQLKSQRFRGTNVRVHDNAFLIGGRYNQITWDVQDSASNSTSSFDHNFLAGKQDRGCLMVLDGSMYPQIKSNYFGNRIGGGPSGQTNGWETIRIGNSGIMAQTIGANIEGNYFDGAEGEFEIISDKTQNNRVAGNTFRNISQGWLTGRHGGGGTYENNAMINTWGIRVGNADDTIPDHPGLTIRNNYIEGPNAKIVLPGNQTDVKILNNTIYVGTGAFRDTEHTVGKFPLEYGNTTAGTISNNLLVINDSAYGAVQAQTIGGVAPTATGAGNLAYNLAGGTIFHSSTPANIRALFSNANPQLARDGYGLYQPASAGPGAGLGAQGTPVPLAKNSPIGTSWMSRSLRLNKMMTGEFQFNGDFSGGTITSTAHNTGYLATPAMQVNASGAATNLHTAGGLGVSGQADDRALDNRSTTSMGSASGKATVANRTFFRGLHAFTLQGWFKTDGAQTIGGGASLIEQLDANGGWALRATANGRLTLTIGDGSTTRTANSSTSFTLQNQWTFFAVTFDRRPSSNEVSFYIGSETQPITLAGQASISSTITSDSVAVPVTIGTGFDGLLDNIRLFTSRRNVTWINDDGTSYVNTDADNFRYALLDLQDLRALRAMDLRIALGDVDENRSINQADIDLVLRNPNSTSYDIDGDGTTNLADADMLIRDILLTQYGDANLDQRVNTLDFNLVAGSFGQAGGWANGDFNGDALVTSTDFNALLGQFGFASPSGVSLGTVVPEPVSALCCTIFQLLAIRPARNRRTSG